MKPMKFDEAVHVILNAEPELDWYKSTVQNLVF